MGDNIKAPSHYVDGRKYEPKDVIRDWGLNFNLGSAVKYISRAGRKGDILEDLRKAKQFLEFEIEAVEENRLLESLSGHSYVVTSQEIREALAKKEAAEKEEHKDDIGITCKEAVKIGDDIAKGFEEGLKEGEETYGEAIQTRGVISDLLSGYIGLSWIPDRYKSRVIDKIVQLVLDSGCDIENDISSDDLREAVIDRIVERINNGELDLMDIPDECVRSRAANANSVYHKVLDGI